VGHSKGLRDDSGASERKLHERRGDGIFGEAKQTQVTNVKNKGDLKITQSHHGDGIFGEAKQTQVTNVKNKGDLKITQSHHGENNNNNNNNNNSECAAATASNRTVMKVFPFPNMVFEETKSSFATYVGRGKTKEQGPLYPGRIPHIECVHLLVMTECQVYIARDLDVVRISKAFSLNSISRLYSNSEFLKSFLSFS
jgi:hypothetical protein